MELDIFGGEKEVRRKVFLKLAKGTTGEIYLVACDGNGESIENGYLMLFESDGRMLRCYNVNPDLGFPLDSKGRIRLIGEDCK